MTIHRFYCKACGDRMERGEYCSKLVCINWSRLDKRTDMVLNGEPDGKVPFYAKELLLEEIDEDIARAAPVRQLSLMEHRARVKSLAFDNAYALHLQYTDLKAAQKDPKPPPCVVSVENQLRSRIEELHQEVHQLRCALSEARAPKQEWDGRSRPPLAADPPYASMRPMELPADVEKELLKAVHSGKALRAKIDALASEVKLPGFGFAEAMKTYDAHYEAIIKRAHENIAACFLDTPKLQMGMDMGIGEDETVATIYRASEVSMTIDGVFTRGASWFRSQS